MGRFIAITFLAVVVGSFGMLFEDATVNTDDVTYPADFGWLFEGNSQESVTEMDETQSVCNTTECRRIAHVLMESMDRSIDPCENFYKYACNNWAKNNPIPKYNAVWNLLYIVQDRVGKQIEAILEEESSPDDIIPLKLARKLHNSCMDLDAMDRRGLEPLVITLSRGNGWPLIMLPEEWDEKDTNWQTVDHYYAHLRGTFTFFILRVRSGRNDTTYHMRIEPNWSGVGLWLLWENEEEKSTNEESTTETNDSQEKRSNETNTEDDSDTTTESPSNNDEEEISVEDDLDELPIRHKREAKRNVTAEEKREAYKQFVTYVAMAIARARGIAVTEEQIAKDVEDLTTFVAKWMKIRSIGVEEAREIRKKEFEGVEVDGFKTNIREVQEWYDSLGLSSSTSKIKWLNTLNVLFEDADVEIDANTSVRFAHKPHFERLAKLLEETSARTLVNFVHWNVISDMLDATTHEMRQALKNVSNFGKDIEEVSEEEDRKWRRRKCSYRAKTSSIVGYEYVKRHFNEENLNFAREMVKEIQDEVEKQIMLSEWMDDATRNHALAKLKHLTAIVGYPDWYKNKTAVNNYYKGMVISPSYFENVLTNGKYLMIKKIRSLTQPKRGDPAQEYMNPAEVNAFYTGNSIVITAADLQGPFFEASRPAMINFAIIGLTIGHEINHGFDANNFLADTAGVQVLTIMADAFKQRAGCFVEQYNNISETANLFNETIENFGNKTAGENIADSMALLAAFHAFKNRENRNGRPEPSLPGFEDFDNDQMFFLSFANMWCETIDPKKGRKKYQHDTHSPGMLRVLGPITNSVEFAEAYNCPVGSPMNPEKKCNIWK